MVLRVIACGSGGRAGAKARLARSIAIGFGGATARTRFVQPDAHGLRARRKSGGAPGFRWFRADGLGTMAT